LKVGDKAFDLVWFLKINKAKNKYKYHATAFIPFQKFMVCENCSGFKWKRGRRSQEYARLASFDGSNIMKFLRMGDLRW
jgi:hypothetical protein